MLSDNEFTYENEKYFKLTNKVANYLVISELAKIIMSYVKWVMLMS